MSIEFTNNSRPPCLREGVGSSVIKNTTDTSKYFGPTSTVKSIYSDVEMLHISPVMRGVSYGIKLTTKDSSGALLVSCVVDLFYTNNDVLAGKGVSDASAATINFLVSPNAGNYYAVAYKQGSPDVAGTSVNTLAPVGV